MPSGIPPEIQELHAYVDGQLSPEARLRVEARLANDQIARVRVSEYEKLRQGLRRIFDPMLIEPVPARLRQFTQRRKYPLGAIAASFCTLAVGLWIGVSVQINRLPGLEGPLDLVREAATAYAVYTPEVRHPVEVTGDQEQHLVAWLSKRLDAEVRVPDLDELGFRLVGGRLLPGDKGPGALFMYENEGGHRVTLYLCREDDAARTTAFRYAEQDRVSLFYWYDGPFSYALAGEIGRSSLLRLAESVYHQIVS